MATELKACDKCGRNRVQEARAERSHRVMCWDCGYSCSFEYWNRRAMPECVRALLALADKSANTLPSADHNGDDFAEAAEAVRKYYGDGGE